MKDESNYKEWDEKVNDMLIKKSQEEEYEYTWAEAKQDLIWLKNVIWSGICKVFRVLTSPFLMWKLIVSICRNILEFLGEILKLIGYGIGSIVVIGLLLRFSIWLISIILDTLKYALFLN